MLNERVERMQSRRDWISLFLLARRMAEDAPARAVCHASRTIADLAKVVNLATPHLRYRKDPAPAPCSAVFARLPEAAAQ